jgi:hypothetical protein
MSYPGRELLIKIVLYAMPTYFLTIFILEGASCRKERTMTELRVDSVLSIGKHALDPQKWEGLGFKDLEKFGHALRLRWL